MTSIDQTTTDHGPLVAEMRRAWAQGITKPLAWRREQLKAMTRMVEEGEQELLDALAADLGKPAIEAWMTDLRFITIEIDHILKHLDEWTRPEKVRPRALLQPAKAKILSEPLGVGLVIAPWNYPVQLLLVPMAYAIAAGNAVVGKPSEITSHTSAAIARLVPRYLDERAVAIVEGDVPVVTSLLEQRWDHIFYTGNGTIGRVIMEAAAKHLTPVVLELGGKSPTIVDRSANLEVAARRIAWGKWLNCGQTCIAPDYVLVDRTVERPFMDALQKALKDFYGDDPKATTDYARIVSDKHHERLRGYLEQRTTGHVAAGGQADAAQRYLAPTIVTDVSWDEPMMQEEIFGPILPVLTVDGIGEAVEAINGRDKPLALYLFAEDGSVVDRVLGETSSGGVCVNGTMMHFMVNDMPFGGVGESGMGAYHGKAGFDTFSHRKSVLIRTTRPDPTALYPPYSRFKKWFMRKAV
jgi:aldehyde dehydrogenase (NAD+)